MSAEYYGIETQEASKLGIDKDGLKNLSTLEENIKPSETNVKNEKLQEIVGNVNWAENRCNNLTNCLDNLKNYYGYQKDEYAKLCDKKSDNNAGVKKQQVPQKVLDEKPDAAMTTVSNILNLLTTTVNKLDTQNKFSHDKKINEMELEYIQKYKTTETSTDAFEKSKSIIINPNKSDHSIVKPVKQPIKKKRIIEKTIKVPNPSNITMTKKRSLKPYRSVTNRLYGKRNNIQVNDKKTISQQKIIQLYRNDELKGSDSDETQTKPTKTDNITVPPIKIPQEHNNLLSKRSLAQTEYFISKAHSYDEPKMTRTELNYYSRNYQLPTIASRMKRVTRTYFNTFNFKAIPFCVATSTSPSHNIGVNIQQFMNLLKTRQPMRGLSRTLTHNIELAAERLNGQPLASLVSTAVSKLGVRCPLLKSNINYQHLQEIAKSIPEEPIEPPEENTNETPTVRSVVITGPAGDVKIKKRKTPKWSKMPSTESTCTCLPKEGVEFNQVMYKQSCANNKVASNLKITDKNLPMVKESQKTVADTTQNNNSSSLNIKQKSLKNVLTNLHNEFEAMNKKFNQLSRNEQTPEVVLELEKLEKELNNKEQEITMVMTLYKELMALKEQMKKLQQQPTTTSHQKISEYANNKTTFHLTKLLKEIQRYQINYKKI